MKCKRMSADYPRVEKPWETMNICEIFSVKGMGNTGVRFRRGEQPLRKSWNAVKNILHYGTSVLSFCEKDNKSCFTRAQNKIHWSRVLRKRKIFSTPGGGTGQGSQLRSLRVSLAEGGATMLRKACPQEPNTEPT